MTIPKKSSLHLVSLKHLFTNHALSSSVTQRSRLPNDAHRRILTHAASLSYPHHQMSPSRRQKSNVAFHSSQRCFHSNATLKSTDRNTAISSSPLTPPPDDPYHPQQAGISPSSMMGLTHCDDSIQLGRQPTSSPPIYTIITQSYRNRAVGRQ